MKINKKSAVKVGLEVGLIWCFERIKEGNMRLPLPGETHAGAVCPGFKNHRLQSLNDHNVNASSEIY